MDERVTVNHFERRGSPRDFLAFDAEKPRRLDGREERPEPLAAAKARVTHRFQKARRPESLARQEGRREQGIEHPFRRIGGFHEKPRLEFACPRASVVIA